MKGESMEKTKSNNSIKNTQTKDNYYPSYLFDKKAYEDLKKAIEKYNGANNNNLTESYKKTKQ